MTAEAAGDIERRAGSKGGERRGEEQQRLRRSCGFPKRCIGIPRRRAISAVQSAQLWRLSARFSKRRRHCPDSTMPSRMELTRMPLPTSSLRQRQRHVEQRRARRRGGDHVFFRLQRQQRVDAGDGGDIGSLQQRQKRLHRINYAEEL